MGVVAFWVGGAGGEGGERKPDIGGAVGRVIKKDGEEAVKNDIKNVLEGDTGDAIKYQTTGSYSPPPVYEQQASEVYQSSYHLSIEYYNLE